MKNKKVHPELGTCGFGGVFLTRAGHWAIFFLDISNRVEDMYRLYILSVAFFTQF